MGSMLTSERGRRAWSRLSQSSAVRHGVRTLVFAGAVGAAWLIGTSAASAHTSTDHETGTRHSGTAAGADNAVKNDTALDRLTRRECQDQPEGMVSKHRITEFELAPANLADLCDDADPTRAPAAAVPDDQAQPRSVPGQLEAGSDSAASRRFLRSLGMLPGETPNATRSLDDATRPVTDDEITTAAPVNHTAGTASGTDADPLLDGVRPVSSAADEITSPVTGALADATRPVADGLSGSVLPRLDGPVDNLVPLPVAGLPSGHVPAHPAPPVAPGVDQSIDSTSAFDSDDAVLSTEAHHTGMTSATRAPTSPAPAPLPAVPGTGVNSGGTTSSYSPSSGGGATATVPAFPVHSALQSSTLLATAYSAALRDLAGEPAVSPD